MQVGTVVFLKQAMLGNDGGAVGVVYETYDIGAGPGASVIFTNGNYDGFSPEEQERFLREVGVSEKHSGYQFTNVMKLSEDFRAGFFDGAFKSE